MSKHVPAEELFRRCAADRSIERVVLGSFAFPLGSYPVEPMRPKPGYTTQFEPADGDDQGEEWEEWPDRYVFDAVLSHERVEPFVRALLALMPPRIYPILDVLGHDAFREIDPYISYDLLPLDRMYDALRQFHDLFFEDGMVGFGAMSEDPFLYVFVDEHKIVTIRAATALKEKIERLLNAFDLEAMPDPAGADSAAHEHRGVLWAPDDRPELLTAEDIVEQLRDQWRLVLNIDPEQNVDDDQNPLGITCWRCLVRCEKESDDGEPMSVRYAEALVTAECLREAEDLTFDALERLVAPEDRENVEPVLVTLDRTTPEQMLEHVRRREAEARAEGQQADGEGGGSNPASPGSPIPAEIDPSPPRVLGVAWLS